MLVSTLSNAQFDEKTAARVATALTWLAETDMAALEPGRHDVAGDEIFANVMAITSCPASEKNFEAHHSYIDIHYVIEGEELLGTAPVGECPALQEFNEADDFCLYGDPADPARVTWTLLRAGELCMTPPADARKPACCVGDPAPLRKACVKVLVG